eukprot:COSAG02_NODE_12933_length_1470_cov_2.498177_3_plen_98_part_01
MERVRSLQAFALYGRRPSIRLGGRVTRRGEHVGIPLTGKPRGECHGRLGMRGGGGGGKGGGGAGLLYFFGHPFPSPAKWNPGGLFLKKKKLLARSVKI